MKLRSYFKSANGNIAIEFALVLPILIIILSVIFEFAMYIYLNNKITQVSGSVGFIASRPNQTEVSLSALMNAADLIAKPFNFNENGGIIVSQINVTSNGSMIIAWQRKVGSGSSKIGSEGSTPVNMPNNIKIPEGQNLIVAEAFYNYKPFVFNYFSFDNLIYHINIFTPRQGAMNLKAN